MERGEREGRERGGGQGEGKGERRGLAVCARGSEIALAQGAGGGGDGVRILGPNCIPNTLLKDQVNFSTSSPINYDF